ncbi:hypothetical protein C0J52_18250 [Blattella germanica]|nr:hypothetical protein C0J52_18250 [Blattella germanica]
MLFKIPDVGVGTDGVSASFGGYKASAGLGGTVNGGPAGGLHAEAGTPDGTGASAGLGGSVGSGGVIYSQAGGPGVGVQSTAGTNHRPRRPVAKRPNDFYDNIFNIPISVLESVNHLLGGSPPKHSIGVGTGGGAAGVTGATGASASAGADFGAQARTGAVESGSGSTSSTSSKTSTKFQAGTSGGTDNPVGGFFDSIFNIPITALKSVNQFLNAKNEQKPAVNPSQTG